MTAIPPMQFKKAERQKVKLKALVVGPSGGGKTKGALAMACTIAPGKVAGIDSENDRMLYYADEYDFSHLSMPDNKPVTLQKAIDAAITASFEVVVIDSLHHAWQDVLDRKEAYDRANPSSNSFSNWKMFSKEWDELVAFILAAPIHIIATSRSKQAYELTQGDRGKLKPVKLGLQPTIRDGTEYEFALVFDLFPSHKARCTKDNTGLFGTDEEQLWNLADPKLSTDVRDWLNKPTVEAKPRYVGPRFPKVKRFSEWANFPMPEVPPRIIEETYKLAQEAEGAAARQIAELMALELDRRRTAAEDARDPAPAPLAKPEADAYGNTTLAAPEGTDAKQLSLDGKEEPAPAPVAAGAIDDEDDGLPF